MWLYWVIGTILVSVSVASIPWFIDRKNIKIIRQQVINAGDQLIKIKLHRNHYGVTFIQDGNKRYVKCQVIHGTIKWLND